jgi:hypothetical protein
MPISTALAKRIAAKLRVAQRTSGEVLSRWLCFGVTVARTIRLRNARGYVAEYRNPRDES